MPKYGSWAVRREQSSAICKCDRMQCLQCSCNVSQALSNTLWAMSKLGFKDTAFMHAIAGCAIAKIATFNAQNIANSVSKRLTSKHIGHA